MSREAVVGEGEEEEERRGVMKRKKLAGGEPNSGERKGGLLESLPDDLLLVILSKLSASGTCPADLVAIVTTCKRLNRLGLDPSVLSMASAEALAVRAKNWSESAHRFLKRCADAGNLEACYIMGMIRFYCLGIRRSGLSLMARAGMGDHAAALFSLAVIHFNGSGRSKSDKNLGAGVVFCARATILGHMGALRELGHCFYDGYGVRRRIADGRRFLLLAHARELAAAMDSASSPPPYSPQIRSLLQHFRSSGKPSHEPHPANRFLVEWFAQRDNAAPDRDREGLGFCSNAACGRPETRPNEFRRCSACGLVGYCSRACQMLHWKLVHKNECADVERWLAGVDAPP